MPAKSTSTENGQVAQKTCASPCITENGITEAQQRTLDAIRDYIDLHQISPSIRDLCNAMNYSSTSSVQLHFNSLQKCGAIKLRPGVPRSVRVLWPRPAD